MHASTPPGPHQPGTPAAPLPLFPPAPPRLARAPQEFMLFGHNLWSGPLTAVWVISALFAVLGWSATAGVLLTVVLVPLQSANARYSAKVAPAPRRAAGRVAGHGALRVAGHVTSRIDRRSSPRVGQPRESNPHTHARTHARTPRARTRARTHKHARPDARKRTRARARARARTRSFGRRP